MDHQQIHLRVPLYPHHRLPALVPIHSGSTLRLDGHFRVDDVPVYSPKVKTQIIFFPLFVPDALQVQIKPLYLHSQFSYGAIAQLVEQRTENPCVPGSIPGGTTGNERVTKVTLFVFTNKNRLF